MNPLICDDTLATIRASALMGASITQGDVLEMEGVERLQAPSTEIDCRESGTTLRIFTALAALTKGECVLRCGESLSVRPMGDLLDGLRQLGVEAHSAGEDMRPPLVVQGHGIRGGIVRIRGDVTSQYITGLILAASRADDDTRIEITTHLESRPYVDMTLQVMQCFGAGAEPAETWSHIDIPGGQSYKGTEYVVEGDYSSAAFLMAAGALTGEVTVSGLNEESIQGDARIDRKSVV